MSEKLQTKEKRNVIKVEEMGREDKGWEYKEEIERLEERKGETRSKCRK